MHVSITLQSYTHPLKNPIGSGIYLSIIYTTGCRHSNTSATIANASLIYHPSSCKRYASPHSLPNSLLPKHISRCQEPNSTCTPPPFPCSYFPSTSQTSLIATTGVAVRQCIRPRPVAPCALFFCHSQARHPVSLRRTLRLAVQRGFWRLVVARGFDVVRTRRLFLSIRWLRLAKVLPFAPTIKVNERLHATPFHHFARQPLKVHGLNRCQYAGYLGSI